MVTLKLEAVVQSVLVSDVAVVAGTERIGSRLTDRAAPTFLPSAWLPANHDADQPAQPNYPTGMKSGGLRAGRPASSRGGLLSRCLPGRAGATSRPRGADIKRAVKQPLMMTARREVPHRTDHPFTSASLRWCRMERRLGTRIRPAL
jgi:hypothetical protein